MPVTIEVKGLRELEATLKAFPRELQAKAVAGAASAGASVVKREIQARARVRHGDLRGKAIGARRGRFKGKGRLPGFMRAAVRLVRVRDGNSKGVTYQIGFLKAAFYWWFVERGFDHIAGLTQRLTKGGHRVYAATKHVAARPFATPGFEAAQATAGEAVRRYLAAQTERIAAAVRRK